MCLKNGVKTLRNVLISSKLQCCSFCRALSTAKKSSQDITENMISESTLVKQLPKMLLDLKSLRPLGVKGRKPGHKGRQTTYTIVGFL